MGSQQWGHAGDAWCIGHWNQCGTGVVLHEHLLQPPVGFSIPGEDLSIFGMTGDWLGSVSVPPMDTATRMHWNIPKPVWANSQACLRKQFHWRLAFRNSTPGLSRAAGLNPDSWLWGRHKCLYWQRTSVSLCLKGAAGLPWVQGQVPASALRPAQPARSAALYLLWPWTLLFRITYNNKGAFWVILLEIHQAV